MREGAAGGQFMTILVIGYGSELRGDDIAGRLLARGVATWHLPNLSVIETHQLTPELAEPIAAATVVIFADAAAEPLSSPHLTQLTAQPAASHGHTSDPAGLLALVAMLYGKPPVAYQVALPACQFELGTPPSATVLRSIEQGLALVRELVVQIGVHQLSED